MSREVLEKFMSKENSYSVIFKHSIISGIGWSLGVTIGFLLLSSVIVYGLRQLGGLPLVGTWIANVVEVTQSQLESRTPVFRDRIQ